MKDFNAFDFKPIRWQFEGDKWSSMKLMGIAKNQLFKLKLMQSNGAELFILSQHYRDGSFISVRTDVPGMDVISIRTTQAIVKAEVQKESIRHLFFGFDWYGDVIEIDPKINIKKSGQTEVCSSCHSDYWTCFWYGTDIYCGCVDRSLNTYWGTYGGGVFRFDKNLKQIACWFDWDDTLGDSVFTAWTCVADDKRNCVYFAGDDYNVGYGKIYRLSTADNTLTNQGMIQLDEVNTLMSSAIDKNSQYAYFGTYYPGRVYMINLENFSIAGMLDVPAGDNLNDAVISDSGKYLILSSHFQYSNYKDGKAVAVRIRDDAGNPMLAYEGSVIVGYNSHALIYYMGHVFVQTEGQYHYGNENEIVKVKIPELQIVDRISSPIHDGYRAVCYPEIGKGFFGSFDYSSSRGSQIAKVNLDKLEIEKLHSFDSSSNYKKLYAACISKPIEVEVET